MANLSEFQQGQWAVGSIQQSLLTEAQFQTEMGTEWVLMDGQSIAGSKLASIIGDNLPDATTNGAFLRCEGGNAQSLAATIAGTVQAEATAKNGLANSASSVSGTALSAGNHTHTVNTVKGTAGSTSNRGVVTEGGGDLLNATNTTGAHTHSLSGTAAAQTITGDIETRPVNITVNYFVKIN